MQRSANALAPDAGTRKRGVKMARKLGRKAAEADLYSALEHMKEVGCHLCGAPGVYSGIWIPTAEFLREQRFPAMTRFGYSVCEECFQMPRAELMSKIEASITAHHRQIMASKN